jgi:DNA methyltransferase 1-associated protein 1
MASSDVRDVLNLPDGAAGGSRPSKKQKISAPRPNLKGLAREVHNLGGDNPIAIVPEVTQFKKRRFVSRKPAARWELRAFRNSGRKDASLVLRHWRRAEEGKQSSSTVGGEAQQREAGESDVLGSKEEEDIEDTLYAKYNVQVPVPQYSDDQYHQVLENPDWSKEETDYLMELVRDFDIRWALIWDRYEWSPPATNGEADDDGDESKAIVPATRSRSMEDLKARYYEVASRMMAVQKPVQYMTQPEFALHELMAHFNPQQEKLRKDFALNSFGRSREEAREEESLLLEIKRILARSDRFNEERRELYNRLDYPHAEQDINTFKSSTGLQTLLQNLMTADKSKKRKSIMGGEVPTPTGQPTPQQAAPENVRRDSVAASTGPRDSNAPVTAPTAGNKKSQQQQQQAQQQQQQQAQQQQQQQSQQQPQERKKLTEQEEIIYGVTHHERLGSGPTFRTEKINKLFSHKSNQQQLRITNTLNELDVPAKLAMPTAATTHAFEQLLASVNSLLDARKVTDKIDAEIKLELAKKAEREKASGHQQSEKSEDADGDAKDDATAADEPSKEDDEDAAEEADPADDEKDDDDENEAPSDEAEAQQSVEQDDDNADEEKGSRLEGTAHKRSASVLSSVSDKSAKRQKK